MLQKKFAEKKRFEFPVFPLIACLWWLSGLAIAFFWTGLRESFFPFERMPYFVWACVGMLILAQRLTTQIGSGKKRRAVVSAFLTASLAGSVLVMWPALAKFGDEARFRWRFDGLRARYESIIGRQQIRSELVKGWQKDGTIDYFVEVGPPMRVAFRQPGGILDNWQGVVYDPSDGVLRANAFRADFSNWNDPALRDVKHLFGGDLQRCTHLRGHFYRCWFT